jgi:hypothetical protein
MAALSRCWEGNHLIMRIIPTDGLAVTYFRVRKRHAIVGSRLNF